jgi:choline dehydrogenase
VGHQPAPTSGADPGAGVDTIVDLPQVGQNLHDHPVVMANWRSPDTPGLPELVTPESMGLWRREGRGRA